MKAIKIQEHQNFQIKGGFIISMLLGFHLIFLTTAYGQNRNCAPPGSSAQSSPSSVSPPSPNSSSKNLQNRPVPGSSRSLSGQPDHLRGVEKLLQGNLNLNNNSIGAIDAVVKGTLPQTMANTSANQSLGPPEGPAFAGGRLHGNVPMGPPREPGIIDKPLSEMSVLEKFTQGAAIFNNRATSDYFDKFENERGMADLDHMRQIQNMNSTERRARKLRKGFGAGGPNYGPGDSPVGPSDLAK